MTIEVGLPFVDGNGPFFTDLNARLAPQTFFGVFRKDSHHLAILLLDGQRLNGANFHALGAGLTFVSINGYNEHSYLRFG
jgi:hypothetical protein